VFELPVIAPTQACGDVPDRDARVQQFLDLAQTIEVVLGIEAIAARGALRTQQSVAPLPRAEGIRVDAAEGTGGTNGIT